MNRHYRPRRDRGYHRRQSRRMDAIIGGTAATGSFTNLRGFLETIPDRDMGRYRLPFLAGLRLNRVITDAERQVLRHRAYASIDRGITRRGELEQRIKARATTRGTLWVTTGGRDCDGYESWGSCYEIPATLAAFEAHQDEIAHDAEGPWYLEPVFEHEVEGIRESAGHRDRFAEAAGY